MLMFIIILSASLYYRSQLGLVMLIFHIKLINISKIFQLFEKVKIPFNAELNKIEISNFGATYEKCYQIFW